MIENAPYIIINNNVKPYFNLALEEYLLKEFDSNCFMLWRNEPCIVVGRNQNTLTEIDFEYVKERGIKVVRRLSGGGAVFHDLGNINFTFIINNAQNSFYDFRKCTTPIIEFLDTLGIKAELSGRNDLIIAGTGQKFSGNAQYRYKGRLLHHGTILFNATINDMTASLKVNPGKLDSKGVKSVSSRVTNIQNHLSQPLTVEEFEIMISNYMASKQNYTVYNLTSVDVEKVTQLVKEKYSTWEWNYGVSPEYNLRKEGRFAGGSVEVYLKVKDEIIKNIRIIGDFFGKCDIGVIEQALIGARHKKKEIMAVISQYKFQDYIADVSSAEFVGLLLFPSEIIENSQRSEI